MISLDRKAFIPNDLARVRLAGYGTVFEELHIIVYAKRNLGLRDEKIAENVWLYPTNSKNRFLYMLDAVRIARRLQRSGSILDIVSGQDLCETGFAAWRIARVLKIPLQLQDHADVFDPYFIKESIGNTIRVLCASFLLPKADCIRVVLPRGKERIIRRFPSLAERIAILPVFTPTKHFRDTQASFSVHEKYPQFSKIFLMATRLVPQKDISFALHGFKDAAVEGSGLLIVGEGPLRQALEREVNKLGLSERVIFLPWEKDLVSYYKTADLFLLSSSYESYCRTLVEAVAAGLPFVSTDVGIASALVESGATGTIVARGDRTGFANAIQKHMDSGNNFTDQGLHAVEHLVGKDETEYRIRYHESIVRCAESGMRKGMRFLFVTQALDLDDPLLSAYHGWVEALADVTENVEAVCLTEGRHNLPRNVRVHSLGKEQGRKSSVRYAWTFLTLAWNLRARYDAVFIHMNQEYMLVAGPLWKLLGKRTYLWRNHYAGSVLTDLAAAFCTNVFCTSIHSYTAKYKKTVFMPVGVNTERFYTRDEEQRVPRSLLFFSRITPSKHLELFIEALGILKDSGIEFVASIVGSPQPESIDYAKRQERRVDELGLGELLRFLPGVRNEDASEVYRLHEVFVNCSPSGMFDKMIFEAAASGCLVITESDDMLRAGFEDMTYEPGDAGSLARHIARTLALSEEERIKNKKRLELFVQKNSLKDLALALTEHMKSNKLKR